MLGLGAASVLFAAPGLAADGGNGSKNFNVPATVPNYFSNEAGPMIGGAAESRRGELYTNQAPAQVRTAPAVAAAPVAPAQVRPAPAVAAVPVAAAPVATAAVPRARTHIAMAVPRGHAVQHFRHAAPTHQAALHGRAPARGAHSPVAHASARTAHAPARATTKISTAHRHARG